MVVVAEDPFFKAQETETIQRRCSSHQVSSFLMRGKLINMSHSLENTPKKGHVNNLCRREEHIHL